MQAPARKENQLNNTKLSIQQLSYSGDSVCGTARIKELFLNSFNFWPWPSAESQVNWIYFLLFAMAPYGVVFQLLALVQSSARAHYA